MNTEKSASPANLSRTLFIRIWIPLLLLTAFIFFYPIGLQALRIFLILAIPIMISWSVILLCRKYKKTVLFTSAGIVLFLFIISLNPEHFQKEKLCELYIQSLKNYEGTTYVWGGENFLGIDCSGLVRKALINANIKSGFMNLSIKPLSEAFQLWYYDCTANALKNSYRGFTHFITSSKSINSLDAALIKPGDIAVTENGTHVLAYLGNGEWIQAAPEAGKVIICKVPSENGWLTIPVHIMRWDDLY